MIARTLSLSPSPAQAALTWLRAHPREAVGSTLVTAAFLAGLVALADPAASLPTMLRPEERAAAQVGPPAVEPMLVRDLPAQTAEALNAAVPIVDGAVTAALPFHAVALKGVPYDRALECLTEAVYYEAATESDDGQRAVAQVVLNRVRHPAYPASVCGVVYQGHERRTGCQFTFTCDGALSRAPMASYWNRSRKVAAAALAGAVFAPVGNATHYHTDWVVPYWASSLVKSAVIGSHIFYRWAGGWGRPPAFTQRYAGAEPDAHALKVESLAAEAADRALAAQTPNADLPAGLTAAQAKARQELPPALARLVEAEIGPKGETRVSLRIASPRGGEAGSKASLNQLDRAMGSDNLRWGLTGSEGPSAIDQKPLGRAAPAAAVAPPTKVGAAKPSTGAAESAAQN
jgi:spore germination cell wall hydrolase CwlJ-like protein